MFSIRIETIDHNYYTVEDIINYSINGGELIIAQKADKRRIVFDLKDINTYHIWRQADS